MTDQLFLSLWLDRNARAHRLKHFETALRSFPFSQREQPQSTVSVYAVDATEAPLLERPMNGPLDIDEAIDILRGFTGEDIAHEVESWWDLWRFEDGDWKLAPTRVLLSCFGPEFDNGTSEEPITQEDLRIEFGVDAQFLPDTTLTGSGRMTESNIRSLLRLVHELDSAVPVAKRQLQTETGENFAERLELALRGSERVQ